MSTFYLKGCVFIIVFLLLAGLASALYAVFGDRRQLNEESKEIETSYNVAKLKNNYLNGAKI